MWFAPPQDRWLLGLPLPEVISIAFAALALATWAWPWIRANRLTAMLAGLVALAIVALTMITVTPLFILAAAASIHWAVRSRTRARPRGG